MNIFVPQSLATMIELREIADVKRNIITPRLSVPIIGMVQDGLLGAYNLTNPSMRIDWKTAMNILSYTSIDDFDTFKKTDMTGQDIFSMIIPSKISTNMKGLVVKKGHIEKGVINKAHIGGGKENSLIHLIWDAYGKNQTQKFIDDVQRLVNNFNLYNGFTVGIGDIEVPQNVEGEINTIFETEKLKVNHMITEMENNPTILDSEIFEASVFNKLDTILARVSKLVLDNLRKDNNFNIMISSGSKGKPENMGQMGGCLGQQGVEGKRVRKKVNGRALPYFYKDDDTALARGFCQRSFLQGLSPTEFMFHNMSSREGLIDTAIKTASSGYVQRKFIKSMEDISVKYDCTVRSANNTILQYTYGDSGADTTRQSRLNSELAEMNNEQVAKKFKFTSNELKQVKLSEKDNEQYYQMLLEMRNVFRDYMMRAHRNYALLNTSYMSPVNFYRIIPSAMSEDFDKKTPLTASYVIDSLEKMLEYESTKLTCMTKEEANDKGSIKYIDEMMAKSLFRYSLHEFLAPKVSIIENGFSKEQFDFVLNEIKKGFNKSIVEPGEMAGIIAAQSLGEPVTQNTLNSVDYECEVLIKQEKTITLIKTGLLIDKLLSENMDKVERPKSTDEEKGDLYYLDIKDKNIFIQSVDENGNVSWNRIDAITKHLPINKDGTNVLLKVTTRLGKEIIATKAKSFLTMKNEKLVFTRGDEIKVGELLPVTKKLEIIEKINSVDISKYFDKSEYIYGSELIIAKQHREEVYKSGSRNWYTGFNGSKFILPYNRADSIVNVMNDNKLFNKYHAGCIYQKTNKPISNIEEKLILDDISGFFFGSYLAEGLSTENFISISNNDDIFIDKIIEFSRRYNIGYHITKQINKINIGWTSQDIRLHSTMLAKIVLNECNTGSENKFVPNFAYNANDEFVKGLIDGYFSGDGTVSSKNFISATSVSKKLLEGLSILLMRFGIRSKISIPTKIEANNRNSNNIKQHYILAIRNNGVKIFRDQFKLTSISKQERLEKIADNNFRHQNGRYEKVPIYINNENEIITMTEALRMNNKLIEKTINSDVFYDEIVSIEEVKPSHEYVYDFTVEPDKTFALSNGLLVADTFHHAGIASMGTANLGVGRTVELLSLSKNPKEPIMKIYLTDEYKSNRAMANKIASHIKYTTIGDLTKRTTIYFDPNPFEKDSFMNEDDVHNIFHAHNPTKNSCQSDITGLPWLIRLELDREKLLNKEITLLDIKSKFCNNWERRYTDLRGVKKDEKQLLEKITACAILSNTDNHQNPIIHIRLDMTDFNYSTVINFQEAIIENFKLKGFEDINDVMGVNSEWYIKMNKETGELEKKQQFVVYTKGINLKDVRDLNNVDLTMTMCNDVVKTYETFGIEAARATLLRELKTNIKEDTCNYQHFSILVDLICYTGGLISIDRHGVNKLDTDPLAKASFEKTVDVLLTAAVFGEKDKMKSVSSRIMAGLAIKGGTGMCELLVDFDMIANSEYLEETEIAKSNFKEIQGNGIIDEVENEDDSDIDEDMYMP